MERLELGSVRDLFSPRVLIILAAVLVAPLLGIGVITALIGQPYLLIGIAALVGVFVTIFAPIELMLLAGILGTTLADSWLVPGEVVYYTRFVPMGMLAMRTLVDIALRRFPQVRIERVFVYPGFLFLGLAFFSVIYSITPDITFQRTLTMAFVIVALGLGLPNYLDSFSRLELAIKAVIVLIAGFVLAGTLLAGGGGQDAVELDDAFVRIRGFFSNPNTQGLMAMLMFYPLVWWWRTEPRGLRKFILALVVVAWAIFVLLSGSRASLVGIVCGGLGLALLYGRSSLRYASLLFFVIAAVLVFALAVPEFARSFDFSTPVDTPTEIDPTTGALPQADRVFLIQRALELGMRAPVLGVGFSASDKVFAIDHVYLVTQGIYVSGSHNSYTRMFVDLGVAGVLLGFLIFIAILVQVWRAPPAVRRDLTVALLTATVITGLVDAFFEDWLYGFGSSSTLPFWFFLALIPIRVHQLRQANAQAGEDHS